MSAKPVNQLLVVLPSLPPGQCGLAGHTIALWRWFTDHRHTPVDLNKESGWKFLLVRNAAESKQYFPNAQIDALPREAGELARALTSSEASCVLVQFVGYGYDKDGLPHYLANGLSEWKSGDSQRKLILMFHETWLWRTFNPFKKAFWLAWLQKTIAKKLVDIADVVVTSNDYYRDRLSDLTDSKPVKVIPIGHNFVLSPRANRNPKHLLVFGLGRSLAITMHASLIKLLADSGQIEAIVLAGNSDEGGESEEIRMVRQLCPAIQLITAFNFEFDNVPDAVANCGLSIIDTQALVLGKSGRFHFSCALGQVPIAQNIDGLPEAPLCNGENFLSYKAGNERSVLVALQQDGTIERISAGALHLSETYFSWPAIVECWREVLPK